MTEIITIKLGKRPYQPADASLSLDKTSIKPFEKLTIKGTGFSGFLKRGNPGVAILIDECRPLTGAKINWFGNFKVCFKMPPFTPGEHVISVFDKKVTITIEESDVIVTETQLTEIIKRDIKMSKQCHFLLPDEKYRACPIEELKAWLAKNPVNKRQYVTEFFDCDNFALSTSGMFDYDNYPKGYAHGELWVYTQPNEGGGHAVDWYLVKDNDGNLKIITVEPQNDSMFNFPSSWEAFVVKM